ncbi:P-loop containing nucleoside triphosphate hydrolase protein [Lipomyces japonicus]|uniref:P-loop containing nucleoside triphosphate hydrolase protein n=1 Tax=Lipomyces japonicus TaxID=56871 RepID=UPI0034D0063E
MAMQSDSTDPPDVPDRPDDDDVITLQQNDDTCADILPSIMLFGTAKPVFNAFPVAKESSLSKKLSLNLNQAQLESVTYPVNSQLQILAGPGTGKTKTLVSRVFYLLSKNVGLDPSNIIVTTFTVKAADEMRGRIASQVGDDIASRLILGTFHSITRRYLTQFGHIIGLESGFHIADDSDSLHFVQAAMTELKIEGDKKNARAFQSQISRFKSIGAPSDLQHSYNPTFLSLFHQYGKRLSEANMLDYDDLLIRCIELLKKAPNVVSNVEAVLVDEFQDTNTIQYELMLLLAQAKNNITIVGDPDQSIYGFRAAETANVKRMRKQYPSAKVINLEENYRSSGNIINTALAIIKQDETRDRKSIRANTHQGQKPILLETKNPEMEAWTIVEEIKRVLALSAGLLKPSDIAILVRSARLTSLIEPQLVRAGIEYCVVGGFRFWEREEVKFFMAYLSVIHSRKDTSALFNVMNNPKRGIGTRTQTKLMEHANEHKISLWDAVLKAVSGELKVPLKAREGYLGKQMGKRGRPT